MSKTHSMRSLRAPALGVLVSLGALACVPELDEGLDRVEGTRVLAVVAEPPEAREGASVRLSALVASDGAAPGQDPTFAFCNARKPLSELGPVDGSCLDAGSGALQALGSGASVTATIGRDACSLFGPRRPSPEPGAPAARAVDPDPSGGFYQPVLAGLPNQPAVLGGVRLDCGLPGANRDVVIEYNQRYRPNQNPVLEQLELEIADGQWAPLEAGAPRAVAAGAAVVLRASFPGCESGVACGGAEFYVMLDPATRGLVEQRERLIASWFATAGGFDEHRTEAPEPELTSTDAVWFAPQSAGVVRLWVVLRDGRGGVTHAEREIVVE